MPRYQSLPASILLAMHHYQPGSTFITAVKCYAARVVAVGSDTTGLGQWAYHKLIGKNG